MRRDLTKRVIFFLFLIEFILFNIIFASCYPELAIFIFLFLFLVLINALYFAWKETK